MSNRSRFISLAFHYTLGIVVFILSIQTVYHSVSREHLEHHDILLAALAGVEALAALLFLFPKTLKIGGYILVVIFSFALIFHGLQGDFGWPLLVYLTGVLYVMEQNKNREN